MPKIPADVVESATDPKVQEAYEAAVQAGNVHMAYPTLITAVNRKVNTGNYENIDVLMGVTLPILSLPVDREAFLEQVKQAAELGFYIASKETGERYNTIKELQQGEKR